MAEKTVDPTTSGADRYGAAGRSGSGFEPADSASAAGEIPPSPGAAFAEFGRQLGEARLFVGYYLRTRLDQLRLSIFRLVLFAVLSVVGLLAGGALVVAASVLVVVGISDLIGTLTGYRWVGELVTGVVLLGIVLTATYVAMWKLTKTSRTATMAEYERRLREQREFYGTDVNERAQRN